MPKKKTNEEFINELKEKAPDIKPLEPYINNATKIMCKCKICGNKWSVTPAHLLYGRGCPVCARKNTTDKRRDSKETYIEKLHVVQPNIEVTGDYVNSQTKIEVCCRICGNKWSVVPSSLLSGTGCPKCNRRYRRNTDEFKEELKTISPHISVVGQYKNAHTKIKVKCNRCGFEWQGDPLGLLNGNDCPRCLHIQTSVIEQILYQSLVLVMGKDHVKNRDKSAIGKEIDVYIPKLGLAIEIGAWYWHSKRIERDIEKEQLCKKAGIHLLTIYEGCPKGLKTELENAVYYSNVLSNEKDYISTRELIVGICKTYGLDTSVLFDQWAQIVKEAREQSRKKDAEQFCKELTKINPDVEYLGEYTGSKDTVLVKCKRCGTEWYASSAYDLLHGHGCPECAKEQRGLTQRMSKEEFKKRIEAVNPDIEVCEEYQGMNQKLHCRCRICGFEWNAKPDSLMYKKRNCPNCSPNTLKSNEQFLEELKTISQTVVPLEEYINGSTGIIFECQVCGYQWKTRPSEVLKGTGCPKCAHRIPITPDEFIARVQRANENIEILGEYIDRKTKVKCRCKTCGYEWNGLPTNLIRGAGCQRCAGTLRLSDEEFLTRLVAINPTIKPLEPYENGRTKLLCLCEVCGYEWKALPTNLLNGHGCPRCKAEKTKRLKSRKVLCVETNHIYDSVSKAKMETGITSITDCLRNRTKTAGGYHWKYVDDY